MDPHLIHIDRPTTIRSREVTFLMTFSSVNPVKIGDGHNMEAVEQAGECLFSDTKVSQMRGGRRVYCSSHSE